MSVEGFEAIVGHNFPQYRQPTAETYEAFDAVVQALPGPVTIVDNEIVRATFDLPNDDELEVIVHSEKVTVSATGEVVMCDEIVLEFTQDDENYELSASDLDEERDQEELEIIGQKWQELLREVPSYNQAWLTKVWLGMTADTLFRPFLVRELLDDSGVELEVSQMWSGGYMFNNGTHIALAAEVPAGTYPPIPDTVEPLELQIAATLPNKMHYLYQKDYDGEEQLAFIPDVRKFFVPQDRDAGVLLPEQGINKKEATLLLEAELGSERWRPNDRRMRRMARILRKATASGLAAIGPIDLQPGD
jgi:hypothetical protein